MYLFYWTHFSDIKWFVRGFVPSTVLILHGYWILFLHMSFSVITRLKFVFWKWHQNTEKYKISSVGMLKIRFTLNAWIHSLLVGNVEKLPWQSLYWKPHVMLNRDVPLNKYLKQQYFIFIVCNVTRVSRSVEPKGNFHRLCSSLQLYGASLASFSSLFWFYGRQHYYIAMFPSLRSYSLASG